MCTCANATYLAHAQWYIGLELINIPIDRLHLGSPIGIINIVINMYPEGNCNTIHSYINYYL